MKRIIFDPKQNNINKTKTKQIIINITSYSGIYLTLFINKKSVLLILL